MASCEVGLGRASEGIGSLKTLIAPRMFFSSEVSLLKILLDEGFESGVD